MEKISKLPAGLKELAMERHKEFVERVAFNRKLEDKIRAAVARKEVSNFAVGDTVRVYPYCLYVDTIDRTKSLSKFSGKTSSGFISAFFIESTEG